MTSPLSLRAETVLGLTSLLLLALTIPGSQADLPFETCEEGAEFEPVPGECGYFIACVGTKGYKMPCPSDLVFSLSQKRCVYAEDEAVAECLQYDILIDAPEYHGAASFAALLGGGAGKKDDGDDKMSQSKSGDEDTAKDKNDEKDAKVKEMSHNEAEKDKDNMADIPGRSGDGDKDRDGGGGDGGGRDGGERDGGEMKGGGRDGDGMNGGGRYGGGRDGGGRDSDGRDGGPRYGGGRHGGRYKDLDDRFDFPRSGFAREQRCRDGARMVPHDSLCHHYYDCSSPYDDQPVPFVEPYEKECPYPQQFSNETNQCEDYKNVDCGERREIVDPCDYDANQCFGPNCRSCRAKFASCLSQPDGIMYWPGRQGTGFWVECKDQRTHAQGDCGSDDKGRMKVFDPLTGRCLMYHEMVERMCEWTGYNFDLPHFDECHMYYDCTNSSGKASAFNRDDFVRMCEYPQLFSVRTGKCEDFEQVECGTRKEAKTPCEYTKCEDPTLASCEGFPDGDNVCRTKEGSPHYVTCRGERTVAKLMCPMDDRGLYMQFAPGVGKCLPVDASDS